MATETQPALTSASSLQTGVDSTGSVETLRQDGLWFTCAGIVGLCLIVLMGFLSIAAPRLEELKVGSGVAIAATFVLWSTAFWKLTSAWRRGLRTRLTSWGEIGLTFFGSALIVAVIIVFRFGRYVGTTWLFAILAVPLVLLLFGRLSRRRSLELTRGSVVLIYLGLSVIALLYVGALWLCHGLNPFEYFTRTNSYWYWDREGEKHIGVFVLWICLATAFVCALGSLVHLHVARKQDERTWLNLFATAAAWILAVVAATASVLWFPGKDMAVKIAIALAPLACGLGLGVGWLLARLGNTRPGGRRWALFALVPCLLSMSFLIPAGGMLGTVAYCYSTWSYDTTTVPKTWVWHLPDGWRALPAGALGVFEPRMTVALCVLGLAPSSDIRDQAMTGSRQLQILSWRAWYEREPEKALSQALAVVQATPPETPATTYDYSAGYLIGLRGNRAQILSRLQGSYSDLLVDGIFQGLIARNEDLDLFDDSLKLCEARTTTSTGWHFLLIRHKKRVMARIEVLVSNPTPANLKLLNPALKLLCRDPEGKVLVKKLLTSAQPGPRKAALSLGGWVYRMEGIWSLLIASALGKTPGCDIAERCMAANLLCQWLGIRPGTLPVPGPGTVLPKTLTPQQEAFIDRVVKRARSEIRR